MNDEYLIVKLLKIRNILVRCSTFEATQGEIDDAIEIMNNITLKDLTEN